MAPIGDSIPSFLARGNPFAKIQSVEALIKRGMSYVSDHDRGGRIYASASAYCARQTMLYGTDKDTVLTDSASSAYMAIGVAIENMIVKALDQQRALLFAQYKLPNIGIDLGGKVDAVVYVDGKLKLLEIKSCGVLPLVIKPEHRAQALMYNAVCGIPASVLYFSRNVADYRGNLQMRELPLQATKEELSAGIFTAVYSHIAITRRLLPSKPNFEGPEACGFCKFIPICWEGTPAPFPSVTPEQHAEMVRQAKATTEELMTDEAVRLRRNGILKFIMNNGTVHAKSVLHDQDWDTML